MPWGGGDVTPESPLGSMESDSAPGGRAGKETDWVKKGVLWHTESSVWEAVSQGTGFPIAG